MPFKTDEKFRNGQQFIELGYDQERISRSIVSLGEAIRTHEDEPLGDIGIRYGSAGCARLVCRT